jgi:hypothetical protein
MKNQDRVKNWEKENGSQENITEERTKKKAKHWFNEWLNKAITEVAELKWQLILKKTKRLSYWIDKLFKTEKKEQKLQDWETKETERNDHIRPTTFSKSVFIHLLICENWQLTYVG